VAPDLRSMVRRTDGTVSGLFGGGAGGGFTCSYSYCGFCGVVFDCSVVPDSSRDGESSRAPSTAVLALVFGSPCVRGAHCFVMSASLFILDLFRVHDRRDDRALERCRSPPNPPGSLVYGHREWGEGGSVLPRPPQRRGAGKAAAGSHRSAGRRTPWRRRRREGGALRLIAMAT